MPFKLIARERQEFHLEKTDEKYPSDSKTMVTIRQAASEEHELRGDAFSEYMREFRRDSETDRVVFHYSFRAIWKKEVWLTMVDCNIQSMNGKPLFRSRDGSVKNAMSFQEFSRAWGELPTLITDEIHEKVLVVNPDWAIDFQGEPVGEETSPED